MKGSPTPDTASQSLYADPLIYDVLHQPGTLVEVRLIERLARCHAGVKSGPLRLLEPASGTGRYLIALARRGHLGLGVDLSNEMTRFARARARDAGVGACVQFCAAPMESFIASRRWAGRVDAAFNPINSIRHLITDEAMLAHLRCVRAALRPGGVYLVGIEMTDRRYAQPTEDVWRARDQVRQLSVHQFVSYLPPERPSRDEVVLSHLTVRDAAAGGRRVRHFDDRYVLRTYSRVQWRRLIRDAGWRLEAVYTGAGEPAQLAVMGYRWHVLRPR